MNFCSIFITILSILLQIGENHTCEGVVPKHRIEEFIQAIVTKFNFHSLKCSYTTLFSTTYSGKELSLMGKVKENTTHFSVTDSVTEDILRNYDFFWQNGNFHISRIETFSPPVKSPSKDSRPKNLLEVITFKQNQNRQIGNLEEHTYIDNYYFYRGEGKHRLIILYKSGKTEVEDYEREKDSYIYASEGDVRINMGYVGRVFNNTPSMYRLHLVQFLQEKGPYYLYEKDGYTILWHEISLDKYVPEEERNGDKLSLEIWFDENKDIKRIREGTFFSRSYGLNVIRDIIGETASCDYPIDIRYDFYYHDYKTFEGGVRIPLRVTVDIYKYDETDPRYEELWEEYKHQKTLAFYVKRATFYKKVINNYREIILHEEGLEINKSIPKETFIAPSVTKELEPSPRLKEKFKKKYTPFIFVSICIFATITAIFITHRYLGWGI